MTEGARDEALDERLGAMALASVPRLGPRRLRRVLEHHPPAEAFDLLRSGRRLDPMVERSLPASDLAAIRREASVVDPDAADEACRSAGVAVSWLGAASYPAQLAGDHEAPAILFSRGDVTALDTRRVGVVGTRNATASGLATARELGRELSRAGVAVVSGLALGIDGAVHEGVRHADGTGRAVAVVGCGLDRPYPRRNAALWEWVATDGLLLSEWMPGTTPDAWRLPLRKGVSAALSEVLVVVERREKGGSLITARMAAERDVEVMAVPGSPRVRASAGTNMLLVDGAAPVTSVDDVLVMLGLDHRRAGGARFDARPQPDAVQTTVLDACRSAPNTLDGIVAATGLAVAEAAMAAARLERMGWLREADGWFETAGSRLEHR